MRIASIFAAVLAGALVTAPIAATAQQPPPPQQQQQQKKKPPPQKKPQQHPQRVQQHPQQQQFKKQNVQQHPQPKVIQQQKVQQQKFQPNTSKKTVIINNNKPPRQVTFKSNRQTFTGTRARTWHTSGKWNYHGRNYSYWRHGPWRHRYGNSWRTYVALSALTAIAVGAATYYPYAYLDVPADYCDGITEDGCQLDWAEVETLEGGLAPACVAYCPWQ